MDQWFDELFPLLQHLQESLVRRGETLATAESCTGGLMGAVLTEVPGSSAFYIGGVNVYADAAKTKLLDVPQNLLETKGAVSAEVAEAMASGITRILGVNYGIALTGIAGPGGGTSAKPVGTVWCGVGGPEGVRSTLFQLHGSRRSIRQDAVRLALEELLQEVGS